ncbi:DUF1802 domain-containing protein [Nostoc sp. 'Peltigera membranacea cyanobiont' 213]|uniref:DUF1802 family protein n=1 Tax=Nostoc sp. 'Peltigera membranacea cyanobiont' 213 TaxID=2014530 RepID=UPI000B95B551|nr:DUF1802 family protein [Nostoc sp. 'Peltigera membranacea cyanobiont' 213]OYD97250.1 DUF1802 domain-containing protein [Nostoc sp. 'Peltigera membranacea cyanobiont' 213]
MSELVVLQTSLFLPALEVEALIQGQIIVAMPRKFIHPGQRFALYPANVSINLLPNQQQYRSNFLPVVQNFIGNLSTETALIKAWAKCELCQMLNSPESLEALSRLTIWTTEAFQQALVKKPYIFLAFLRVYLLPEPQEITVEHQSGHFLPLPNSLIVSEDKPVLNDRTFAQRKRQLEKLEPPLHPELEELQSAIASLSISQPAAKQLDDDIKVFLGWSSDKLINQPDSNLAWINDIAKFGDRSIEQDEGKSNYQAGTDFEIIARRSLDFLGFKVEENYKGGAGGLDLFCSQPYPVVCECKAGKSIPDRAVEELDRIGRRHLKENYLQAVRLIIGPGKPTKNLKESAEISKISIINVMSLQKLVELKAKHPGAINLVELKQCLEPGQIDYKIDEYIDKAEREIRLRSHIIQLVKNYLQNSGIESAGVESLHGAYFGSYPPQPIKTIEMHEILIELSSPLTGYLGRIKGSNWNSDRFYFLRDLLIN